MSTNFALQFVAAVFLDLFALRFAAAAFLDLFALWLVAATFLDPFALLPGAVCLGEGLGCGFAVLQLSSGSLLLFLLPSCCFGFGGGPLAVFVVFSLVLVLFMCMVVGSFGFCGWFFGFLDLVVSSFILCACSLLALFLIKLLLAAVKKIYFLKLL